MTHRPLLYRSRRARPRASLPVFAVAMSWLLLTAMLPLTVKNERAGLAQPAAAETDLQAQRERQQPFSENLRWPFGLPPSDTQGADAVTIDPARELANCS